MFYQTAFRRATKHSDEAESEYNWKLYVLRIVRTPHDPNLTGLSKNDSMNFVQDMDNLCTLLTKWGQLVLDSAVKGRAVQGLPLPYNGYIPPCFRRGLDHSNPKDAIEYNKENADAVICFNTQMNVVCLFLKAWGRVARPVASQKYHPKRNMFLEGLDEVFGVEPGPPPRITEEDRARARECLANMRKWDEQVGVTTQTIEKSTGRKEGGSTPNVLRVRKAGVQKRAARKPNRRPPIKVSKTPKSAPPPTKPAAGPVIGFQTKKRKREVEETPNEDFARKRARTDKYQPCQGLALAV
ncbi:hypothetical protein FN846DRAFT_887708 [Sphaerosporella brunnea]|uniref:Uncharacterized protein n=1 Tax=Sphaerosporella brunnea TaxID=1250544 RepID=A0A5J5F575_9PEZI|nr:hypothetical protein FN846DRAFT_887708 [Sphaerosporella brunnea]